MAHFVVNLPQVNVSRVNTAQHSWSDTKFKGNLRRASSSVRKMRNAWEICVSQLNPNHGQPCHFQVTLIVSPFLVNQQCSVDLATRVRSFYRERTSFCEKLMFVQTFRYFYFWDDEFIVLQLNSQLLNLIGYSAVFFSSGNFLYAARFWNPLFGHTQF